MATKSWSASWLLLASALVLFLVVPISASFLPDWSDIVKSKNETAINETAPAINESSSVVSAPVARSLVTHQAVVHPIVNQNVESVPATRSLVTHQPMVNPVISQNVVSPQQRRQESIRIDFIPSTAPGQQGSPPVIHAAAQMTPDQLRQFQAGATADQVNSLVINPADIQFTVPDMPDSVGAPIIDQIRAQLGTKPLALSELNQKFVSFSANVPGVMINRTVVTSIEEQMLDQQNRTNTRTLVRGVPATSYSSSSSTYASGPTGSYSTQYQPIVSYPYNPALSYQRRSNVDPYSQKTYSEQSYQYTLPQGSAYQTKTDTPSYQQTQQPNYQQQQGYQKPQEYSAQPVQTYQTSSSYQSQTYQKPQENQNYPKPAQQSYAQQQQEYKKPQEYSTQPAQTYQTSSSYQSQTYQKPQETQSYQTQAYQKPQESKSYQQKPVQSSYVEPQPQQQQVKIVYIEVCSNPQAPSYGAQPQLQPAAQYQIPEVPTYTQAQIHKQPPPQQYQQAPSYEQYQQPAQSGTYNQEANDLKEVASGLGTIGGELKSSVNEAGTYASASYQAVGEAQDIVQQKLAQMRQLQQEMLALQGQLRLDNYSIQLPAAPIYSTQSYGGAQQSYGAPVKQQTSTSYGPNYSTATLINREEYSNAKLDQSPKVQQQQSYSQPKVQQQQQYKSSSAYNQQKSAPQQTYQQASYSPPQQSYSNGSPNLKITSKVSEEKMTINSQQPNYGTPKYN